MRKLLLLIILLLLPSLCFAALLTGMTPSSYTLPSGWTLVRAQDFESSAAGTSPEWFTGGARTSALYHTGSWSSRGYYSSDAADFTWGLGSSAVGTFSEIYISWWEYIPSEARFNDEMFHINIRKEFTGGYQHIVANTYTNETENSGFNVTKAKHLFQGEEVPFSTAGRTYAYYGPTRTITTGRWKQFEIHLRPNTFVSDNTWNNDGFMRWYEDGTLIYSKESWAPNGGIDYRNGGVQIRIGGVYTKHIWRTGDQQIGPCSSAAGTGYGYDRAQHWDNCSLPGVWGGVGCPNQCPPSGTVPKFYRYIDDVIIMKLGTGEINHTQHWNTISPWTSVYDQATIDNTQYATGSPPSSLKFTYSAGRPDGTAPDKIYWNFSPDQDSFWFEYYFKYSDSWDWHPVGDKQTYWTLSTQNDGEFMLIRRADSGDKLCWCWQSNVDGRSFNRCGNTANSAVISDAMRGQWVKVRGYTAINTAGVANGVAKLWINGNLTHDYSDILMRPTGSTSKWHTAQVTPVWGGNTGVTKASTDYFWVDYMRISTLPFEGDVQPPYIANRVPSSGATGVPITNKTITFDIKDDRTNDTGVKRSSIGVTVEGASVSSTIIPTSTSATSYSISYTSPINWTNGQVVNVTATATDVDNNSMNSSWSFTAATVPDNLVITTSSMPTVKVGTSVPITLTATGGNTSSYTWSLDNGSLPPNRTIAAATGVISGTYTQAGTYNFGVKVTDASSTTATKSLSQTVLPADNVIVTLTVEDTWINSGSPTTNYVDNTNLKVYDWPEYTPANRIIVADNTDILAIPSNSCVTDAKLKLWLTGKEGSGGSNPMRIYAYNITGTVPDLNTVTWDTFAGTLTQLSYTDVGLDNGWISWNITNAVQTAYSSRQPVYILLDGGTANVRDSNRTFLSYENGDETKTPLFVITYSPRVGGECDKPVISAPGRMRVTKIKGKFH